MKAGVNISSVSGGFSLARVSVHIFVCFATTHDSGLCVWKTCGSEK